LGNVDQSNPLVMGLNQWSELLR